MRTIEVNTINSTSRVQIPKDTKYKTVLKAEGLLTRDPRVKERKKYGQKRARKRFQFSKR